MEKIDYLCGALAFLALIAWALTKDANVAIVLSLGTDIMAYSHTYQGLEISTNRKWLALFGISGVIFGKLYGSTELESD